MCRVWAVIQLSLAKNEAEEIVLLLSFKINVCSRQSQHQNSPQSRYEKLIEELYTVPDHVTFLNQATYSGNLVQTELPIERKPNQITFG